jgi:hypothetical protein
MFLEKSRLGFKELRNQTVLPKDNYGLGQESDCIAG